jgi:putative component of toxin-antitoxin plasmid stabilization module
VTSRIKESPRLVREAERAGKSNQDGIDRLMEQLRQGNTNPGLGSKPIGDGLSEARGRDGSRVYFRETPNGIEILGKSNKENQQSVIDEVLRTFGRK